MLPKALLSLFLSLSLLFSESGGLASMLKTGPVSEEGLALEMEFTAEDAVCYLDGVIGVNYLGRFDPAYLELTGITEEEAWETYDWSLEVEGEYFSYYCGFETVAEEYLPRLKALFAQVYRHARYELSPATRLPDDSYAVEVTVEPMDIIHLISGGFDAHMEPFFARYPTEVVEALNDEEFLAIEREWAGMILELFEEKLPQMGHLEPRACLIRLKQDKEGCWRISDEDFAALDERILDYPISW